MLLALAAHETAHAPLNPAQPRGPESISPIFVDSNRVCTQQPRPSRPLGVPMPRACTLAALDGRVDDGGAAAGPGLTSRDLTQSSSREGSPGILSALQLSDNHRRYPRDDPLAFVYH
jgi:hypothetical protein